MKEIQEDYLAGYKKEDSVLITPFAMRVIMVIMLSSFIYLAFKGAHYLTAFALLLSVTAYGLYKELNNKCKCGKRCEIALYKKSLNGPKYSKSHHSFKYMHVTFCDSCKRYSESDYEPPRW